jgi:hypothetical protein
MIHPRQGLSFLLEGEPPLPCIHPQHDDLKRDPPPDWLLLHPPSTPSRIHPRQSAEAACNGQSGHPASTGFKRAISASISGETGWSS